MYSLFLLGVVAFIASLLLTPVVRNLARRWHLVDQPGERKIHRHPIPRVGGAAIALAYLIAYGVLLVARLKGGHILWAARVDIWRLLPAAILIFAVGLVDDLWRLKPWQKILGQALAALLAYAGGIHVTGFAGHQLAPWLAVPATIAWLLLCTNALNLIDGMDGLAVGVGLFATTTTLLAAVLQGNIELALATGPLVGALLGFLRFNFNPATIFLGDCGSLFIGFLLGCYGVLWSQKSATIIGMTAPLLTLAIPLLDTSLAIARRFLRQKPIFGADRAHIHHRLLDRGLTPRRAVLLIYAFCALGGIASLLMASNTYAGLAILLFCLVTWIGIQHLGYVEFGVAGRMFMNGAFRRQINTQLAIHTIEDSLVAAATPDDCWSIIEKAGDELGFHHMRMELAGRAFEHRNGIEPQKCWNMRIPLSSNDYLELTREFGAFEHAGAMAPFADAIRRSLAPKLAVFQAAKRLAASGGAP